MICDPTGCQLGYGGAISLYCIRPSSYSQRHRREFFQSVIRSEQSAVLFSHSNLMASLLSFCKMTCFLLLLLQHRIRSMSLFCVIQSERAHTLVAPCVCRRFFFFGDKNRKNICRKTRSAHFRWADAGGRTRQMLNGNTAISPNAVEAAKTADILRRGERTSSLHPEGAFVKIKSPESYLFSKINNLFTPQQHFRRVFHSATTTDSSIDNDR